MLAAALMTTGCKAPLHAQADALDRIADRAPLKRNITAEEVGDTCAFLASPMSRGITGSTLYVDAGYHIMGL